MPVTGITNRVERPNRLSADFLESLQGLETPEPAAFAGESIELKGS
jgi:hypothetical protein